MQGIAFTLINKPEKLSMNIGGWADVVGAADFLNETASKNS